MAEIDAAKKREKEFRKEGEEVLKIYEGEQQSSFNILFSNTETILPALYSRAPRPYVERRFKDNDELGKAAGQAGTRMLEFLVDTNLEGYDGFHDTMEDSTLSSCLPGRGSCRVKYDAEITEGDYTAGELVCTKKQSWKRFYHGYARTWSAVPWVAYEYDIDKVEATKQFGEAVANKLNYTDDRGDDKDEAKDKQDQHRGEKKVVRIFEIWDKDGGRTVRFFCPNYNEGPLKEIEDPLELSGFFDCPRPLVLIKKHDNLIPTAPYRLYRKQAEELNELSRRIIKLTKALKARGLYAGDVSGDLQKLMEADDNELVPADTAGSLSAEKGLQNAIWMLPLDQWIVVLRELMGVREQCKQTIYEITGISDILRGSTKASETLGAQELKNQWGTLRLKNKQAEVQRYCRDVLRLMLELAAKHFSEDTWAQMTGLPFLTQMQAEQLMMQMQAAMQAAMQDPKAQQAVMQMQQQLQVPKWADVLKLLQNDLQRAYKIDIETNSTVEPEATDDRKELAELLMACGQFIQGVAPLVQSGVMPFEIAKAILMMISKAYPRFGAQIEDLIKNMQAPKPPDEQGAEQVQKEKEMASKELEMQKKMAETDIKMKEVDFMAKAKQKEMDLQLREAQLQVDTQVFGMQQQTAEQSLSNQAQLEGQKLDFKQKEAALQNGKFKTENVANQKVDQGLQKGIGEMKAMVQQLVQVVGQQQQQTQKLVEGLSKALTAPRVRKAIRGKDGRLEAVEEQVA